MHEACRPGGIMLPIKWYHFSITNHDFLLAAMILCLDLMNNLHERKEDHPVCIVSDQDKIDVLQNSRAIWTEIVDECRDAKRAVKILTVVLQKILAKTKERDALKTQSRGNVNFPIASSATNPSVTALQCNQFFTDCVGLGMPVMMGNTVPEPGSISNSTSYSQSSVSPEGDVPMQDNFLDNFGSFVPADFNWDSWDLFMTSQAQTNHENTYQEKTPGFISPGSLTAMEAPSFRYPFVAGHHLANS